MTSEPPVHPHDVLAPPVSGPAEGVMPPDPPQPPQPPRALGEPETRKPGSPGWFPVTVDEFERRMHALHRLVIGIDDHLSDVEEIVTRIGEKMAANFDQLDADLNTLATGYQAVVAERDQLKQALAAADAAKAQAVADAVAADQAAVDAADGIAQSVLNPPAT